MSENQRLHEEAARYIPGGVNSGIRNTSPPLVWKKAEGAFLTDAEDRRYLDYHCAFGPLILGHNHPAVTRAITETLAEIDLPGNGVTELELELARKITRHVPSAERVLLCSTGSEATFHTLRVSRAATGRKKILKFQGCYHGSHDYTASSAGILPEVLEHTLVCDFNDLEGVERAFRAHPGEIAAVILEPLPLNLGCVLPQPGFLAGLRELTTRQGAVLVFDEVITGFRCGLGGYQQICGVKPDLTALGKAIANGFPLAAICGRADLMERFSSRPGGDTYFAGTYNGHAAGCAAALATISLLEKEPAHRHINALGERMRAGLGEIVGRLGLPCTVAGFGSVFLTLFLTGEVRSHADLARNDEEAFLAYRRELLTRGVFKAPLNLKRCHISYAHTEADIARSLEACEGALRRVASARPVTGKFGTS